MREDRVNQRRLKEHNEKQLARKANEQGDPIPVHIPQAIQLSRRLEETTAEIAEREADGDTYRDFANRTRANVVKMGIVLYIAHGCQWTQAIDQWCERQFLYLMDVKMALFGARATEEFLKKKLSSKRYRGTGRKKSALRCLKSPRFTREEFEQLCKENGYVVDNVRVMISKYKSKGYIAEVSENVYEVTPASCVTFGLQFPSESQPPAGEA